MIYTGFPPLQHNRLHLKAIRDQKSNISNCSENIKLYYKVERTRKMQHEENNEIYHLLHFHPSKD